MIEVHCLAPRLWCNDRVSCEGHVDTFCSAAITSLGVEHNHGQQCGCACGGLAVVGIDIAIVKTDWTSGNLIRVRVILAASRKDGKDIINIVLHTWFADIVETIGVTVFALNSLTISISGTNSSESLITVRISLALVGDFLASICVRVTEVSSLEGLSGLEGI